MDFQLWETPKSMGHQSVSGDTLVRALQSQLVDEIISFLLRRRGMMLRDNATFCVFDEKA